MTELEPRKYRNKRGQVVEVQLIWPRDKYAICTRSKYGAWDILSKYVDKDVGCGGLQAELDRRAARYGWEEVKDDD